MHAGPHGVDLGAGGEVFIGGKAEIEGQASAEVAGVKATATGKAAVTYGLGGKFKGRFTFKDGKIAIEGSAGLTVGVGAEASVSAELDVSQVADKIVAVGRRLFGFGRRKQTWNIDNTEREGVYRWRNSGRVPVWAPLC